MESCQRVGWALPEWLDDALDQKGRVEVGDSSLESCAIAEVRGSSVACCELRVECCELRVEVES